jgi:hypothetical protein
VSRRRAGTPAKAGVLAGGRGLGPLATGCGEIGRYGGDSTRLGHGAAIYMQHVL